ncbi:hypothetical protein [Acutalibacter muris]|uniref:hypothetical protein n=1 Tax=Acutalibacter muris TaxID=1796620 RepID=UPI0025D401C3|nr:hypothetical protein [Acutalibacter muris]
MSETTNKTELAALLHDICKNEDQMKNLVKELEGSTPNKGENTLNFCKMYTALVLERYCHSLDDRELMLAACGLLQGDGFQEENMEDRIVAYWEYSRSYNKHFKRIKTAGSAKRTASGKMNYIIDYLQEDLINAKNSNHGKLGLINKVPDKLEFPSPREMPAADKEPEKSIPPKADGEIEPEAPAPESGPADDAAEEDAAGQEEYKQKDADPPAPAPTAIICEKIKKAAGYLKMRFRIKDVVVILILLFIASTVWKIARSLKDSQSSQQYVETASGTAIEENGSPTVTDIKILNAEMTLTPDKPWEKLEVVIYPREANIDDVNYTSDNTRLVTVNRNTEVVKLASEWRKETEWGTKVHVQFEEIDAEVSVAVQENTADGETSNPNGSILDGDDSVNTENIPGF